MVQEVVGGHGNANHGSNKRMRGAIDSLLTSQSTQVVAPDNIKLTTCSPDIEVVINKQGGICTKCNTMFKSRSSLINHLEKCGIKLSSVIPLVDLKTEPKTEPVQLKFIPSIVRPKLLVIQ